MNSHRLRWGVLAWLLTLQFFVVETVVQLRGEGHSRIDDVISDLGTTDWPGHQLMNASFVIQAALILGGAALLLPAVRSGAGRVALYLFGVTALGALLVGVFPSDRSGTWHAVGATLYLFGSTLGLIALAYALRRRSELVGTVLAVLGLLGVAATTFFITDVAVLARGATERIAAYVLPIGLTIAALTLWRTGEGPAGDPARPSRREERARERSAAEERARERDEALEAAARRTQPGASAAPRSSAAGPVDDFDADDPWAPTRRTDQR